MLLAALLSTVLMSDSPGVKFFEGSWEDAVKEARASRRGVMIDFYTEWCGWCKVLDRETWPQKNVADAVGVKFVAVKLDAEKGEGIQIAKRHGIGVYPTILFVDAADEEIDRIIGYRPPDKFLEEFGRLDGADSFKSLKAKAAAHPGDLETALAMARKYEERNDFDAMERCLKVILQEDKAPAALRTQAEGRIAILTYMKSKGVEVAPLEKFFEANAAGGGAIDQARSLHYHYQRKKDIPRVLKTGDYLLQHAPEKNNAEFHNNLAWFLATSDKELKRSVELARKAVELSPKSPHIIDTLAETLFRSGLYKEAVEAQRRAISLVDDKEKKRYEERLQKFEKRLAEKDGK